MYTIDELIARLLELAQWANANIYEVPIDLQDVLTQAAAEIENGRNYNCGAKMDGGYKNATGDN